MNQRVLVIGGGISGLTSAIYARKSGFDTLILESTVNLGGECTGWDRQGFHIDNSIHWLLGTDPYQDLYKVWCQVGALGPDVKTTPLDPFFATDTPSGRKFHMYLDLDKLRAEMISFGPEDEEAIDEFISALQAYGLMLQNAEVPMEISSIRYKLRFVWSMRKVIPIHRKFATITIEEYSRRFKSEDLRFVMNCYFPKGYYAEALLYILGYAVKGNTNLPEGGSLALEQRMERKYAELGGKVRTSAPVEKIIVKDGKAVGVQLRGGEILEAEYVISSVSPQLLLDKMLDGKFEDGFFHSRLRDRRNFPTFSNTVVYIGCEGEPGEIDPTAILKVKPFRIGRRLHDHVLFHHYADEPHFAPKGHFVLQCLMMQYEADFETWKRYNEESAARYREEKKIMADALLQRLSEKFPHLAGKMKVLEVTTPMSFHKRCGSHKGSYMSFIRTPYAGTASHTGRIPGLKNLYVGGQWTICGGMPCAVMSGRFATQRLCHDAKVPFVQD